MDRTSSMRMAARVAARYQQAMYIPGEVAEDGWEPGSYAPAPVEGEGSQVPPARDSLGFELDSEPQSKSASEEDWAKIFDSLKPRQTIWVAMTAVMDVMGRGRFTDGKFHEWKVGRRSRSKKYNTEAIILMPMDGSKPNSRNAYRLRKSAGRNWPPDPALEHLEIDPVPPSISASVGDMWVSLKGLKAG